MINELVITKKLREVISTELNNYLGPAEESDVLSSIGEKNVVIDFPAPDQMPMNVMFYIQPNYADFETLSVESDSSVFNVSVFILCKRDKQENLTLKIYGYFNALYRLLRNDLSLSGTVDFSEVTDVQFYPAIEANRNIQGAEINIAIRYTKDY